MTAIRLAGCVAAIGLACLVGCTSQSSSSADARDGSVTPELVAQARPQIVDVPVPVGFELDDSRSRNYAPGGARFVDHMYEGSADKWAVMEFYKRHMPLKGWVPVMQMFVQGDITLDFEKDAERCRIIVTKGSLFHPTNIKVQLWTSGRIEAPVTKPKKVL